MSPLDYATKSEVASHQVWLPANTGGVAQELVDARPRVALHVDELGADGQHQLVGPQLFSVLAVDDDVIGLRLKTRKRKMPITF